MLDGEGGKSRDTKSYKISLAVLCISVCHSFVLVFNSAQNRHNE